MGPGARGRAVRIDVLTLFPEVFELLLSSSIVGRAQSAGLVEIHCRNIRDHATDKHRSVDDKPFGGGPGMVLTCGPVFDAVEASEAEDDRKATRILLTPQGERLNQAAVQELAGEERLLLICGHYEGFDERIRVGLSPREISIGDFVLSGGEPAAMVLIDAVVRLLPGALGDADSAGMDSFSEGLLECEQYTRPREFRGMGVPEILLSGNHQEIARWRAERGLARTRERRPDLLKPETDGNDPDDSET